MTQTVITNYYTMPMLTLLADMLHYSTLTVATVSITSNSVSESATN